MAREAYLESIQAKTGKTLAEFISLAEARGFGPGTKAQVIMTWLKEDFALGHGHAMALMHAIKSGSGPAAEA